MPFCVLACITMFFNKFKEFLSNDIMDMWFFFRFRKWVFLYLYNVYKYYYYYIIIMAKELFSFNTKKCLWGLDLGFRNMVKITLRDLDLGLSLRDLDLRLD